MAKKQIVYKTSLSEAIAAAKKQVGKPLFIPSVRRSIPMRHKALGELMSGVDNPGLPTGCFIEVVGQAHAGKTTTTFAMADAVINQPDDPIHRIITENGVEYITPPKRVLFMDFEQIIDVRYLKNACRNIQVLETDHNGKPLNLEEANVFIHQPDTVEEGGDIMLHMIKSRQFGLVIIDSVASMTSKEESEKSMSADTIGKQAKAISMFLRKSASSVSKYGVTVALINQWRDKIGINFGDPRYSPGGKAPEFWDAIKLDIQGPSKTPWFAEGKTVRIKCMKNKIIGAKKTVTYHLEKGYGISAEVELIEMASAAGIIKFTNFTKPVYLVTNNGDRKFKNPVDLIEFLRARPKLFDQIMSKCVAKGITSNASIPTSGGWGDDDEDD